MTGDRAAVERWIERYVHAWETNDPEDVGSLFTDDARYYTAPYRVPWSGRDGIVAGWLGRKDDPGTWSFRSEILAVADGVAFVRGWTTYRGDQPPDYSNLWMIRLEDEGLCSEFVEWWMAHEEPSES